MFESNVFGSMVAASVPSLAIKKISQMPLVPTGAWAADCVSIQSVLQQGVNADTAGLCAANLSGVDALTYQRDCAGLQTQQGKWLLAVRDGFVAAYNRGGQAEAVGLWNCVLQMLLSQTSLSETQIKLKLAPLITQADQLTKSEGTQYVPPPPSLLSIRATTPVSTDTSLIPQQYEERPGTVSTFLQRAAFRKMPTTTMIGTQPITKLVSPVPPPIDTGQLVPMPMPQPPLPLPEGEIFGPAQPVPAQSGASTSLGVSIKEFQGYQFRIMDEALVLFLLEELATYNVVKLSGGTKYGTVELPEHSVWTLPQGMAGDVNSMAWVPARVAQGYGIVGFECENAALDPAPSHPSPPEGALVLMATRNIALAAALAAPGQTDGVVLTEPAGGWVLPEGKSAKAELAPNYALYGVIGLGVAGLIGGAYLLIR